MPWETEGDGIRFSGELADLMALIMTAYDQDTEAKVCDVSPGVYVTATAIVLREVILESMEPSDETADFLQRTSDAMHEDEDGAIEIATFALLDDIAENITTEALDSWMGSKQVRDAINDLAMTAFAVE